MSGLAVNNDNTNTALTLIVAVTAGKKLHVLSCGVLQVGMYH